MRTRRLVSFELRGLSGFLAVGSTGALLVILVCLWAPLSVQIAAVGLLVVSVLSLMIARGRQPNIPPDVDFFSAPLTLARDKAVFETYQAITGALAGICANKDPIYRDVALERANHFAKQLHDVSEGRIIFTGTETWRMVYGRLLRSPGLYLYRSVAFAKTSTYWQDEPGRQSMQVNFEMVDSGTLNIERIVILPDHLWPAGERFPVQPLHEWIGEQYNQGIWIRLVRQSALAGEADLIVDLGIYGSRAVGFQELDEHGRTVRFVLSFDFAEILAAEQRWERLSVYSTSYQKILDPSARPG